MVFWIVQKWRKIKYFLSYLIKQNEHKFETPLWIRSSCKKWVFTLSHVTSKLSVGRGTFLGLVLTEVFGELGEETCCCFVDYYYFEFCLGEEFELGENFWQCLKELHRQHHLLHEREGQPCEWQDGNVRRGSPSKLWRRKESSLCWCQRQRIPSRDTWRWEYEQQRRRGCGSKIHHRRGSWRGQRHEGSRAYTCSKHDLPLVLEFHLREGDDRRFHLSRRVGREQGWWCGWWPSRGVLHIGGKDSQGDRQQGSWSEVHQGGSCAWNWPES